MRRASKRLIHAIIALVASVILCIGACLAWFAMNNEVCGNGLQTQVKSGDIVSFEVEAYYLDFNGSNTQNYIKAETGNVDALDKVFDNNAENKGTLGKLDTFEDSKNDEMRPYDPSKAYASAVLFKVEYEIEDGSSKTFRIFAECDEDSLLNVERVGETTNFTSGLSNTVTFVSATQYGTAPNYTYTQTVNANPTAFVGGVGLREKSFHLNLKGGIADTEAEGNYKGTDYFIMDYEKERFAYISSLLLKNGGGLNSSLTLTGDIALGIEEYDPTTTEYTVTFMDGTTQLQQKQVDYNTTVSKPNNPEKTGYTFNMWCSDEALTMAFDFANNTITKDTTIYAKWTINEYTVTYNLDGGTNHVNNPATYTIEDDTITLQDPTKNGYTFNGWVDSNSQPVTQIAKGSTGDLTLTAKWTANGGKVTYTFTEGTSANDKNPWEWEYDGTYSSTVSNVTYSSSVRVDGNNTFILNATGSQVTIAMNGFTNGSGNASQYIQVDLLDENGYSLKTIYGTTGTGKVPGDFTFDDNGVIVLESGTFTRVKFSLKSGGKHYGILSATITVK